MSVKVRINHSDGGYAYKSLGKLNMTNNLIHLRTAQIKGLIGLDEVH